MINNLYALTYLVVTDVTWRTLDILQCYTLRWLVEVVLEDWKLYDGWAGLAKQPDEDGSVRGVTLSLLLDHALLTLSNLPAWKTGHPRTPWGV